MQAGITGSEHPHVILGDLEAGQPKEIRKPRASLHMARVGSDTDRIITATI